VTFATIDLRLPRPDLAISHTSWQMTGDARTAEFRTGMMTLSSAMIRGRWQIVASQNTEVDRKVS